LKFEGKIQTIKVLRDFTGLGLVHSKLCSEHLPLTMPWLYNTYEDAHRSTFSRALKEIGTTFEVVKIKNENIHKFRKSEPVRLTDNRRTYVEMEEFYNINDSLKRRRRRSH
jgi:hypothetical protein